MTRRRHASTSSVRAYISRISSFCSLYLFMMSATSAKSGGKGRPPKWRERLHADRILASRREKNYSLTPSSRDTPRASFPTVSDNRGGLICRQTEPRGVASSTNTVHGGAIVALQESKVHSQKRRMVIIDDLYVLTPMPTHSTCIWRREYLLLPAAR
jgi:hypothetical protein